MSAFLVDKAHIDALVQGALDVGNRGSGPLRYAHPAFDRSLPWSENEKRLLYVRREDADRLGALLIAENQRSVNHRYDEDHLEPFYQFTPLPGATNPLVILKAIACYEYQSCEHAAWDESEAAAFCEELRKRTINRLPGYDEAAGWDVSDSDRMAACR